MNDKEFSLDDIRRLCLAYDRHHGEYPEHEYEGLAFYHFLLRKSCEPGSDVKRPAVDEWEVALSKPEA